MPRWRYEDAFDTVIERHAGQWNVPVALVKGVIARESAFRPEATGAIGERGLMQITDATARGLGYTGHLDMLYEVGLNIGLGTRLLAENYRQAKGQWDVAVAAYNAGWSRQRPADAPRAESGSFINQDYVNGVMDNWQYFDPRAPIVKGPAESRWGWLLGFLAVGALFFFQKGR